MAESALQVGYHPYGRTLYDPSTAIYAAVEAEDWEPAAPQRLEARRRAEILDAASLDLGVAGWTGWTAKGSAGANAARAAAGSRVPGLISAAPPPHAAGARSITAAAGAQQVGPRPVGILHIASSLPRDPPAADSSQRAQPRPRTERASRVAELLAPDGLQHSKQTVQPTAAAAVPFDAEKAFRRAYPPGAISLKHIASQPPQPAEAAVQQARRLADAPPLGTSSSKAEGSTSVHSDLLLLPAPGAEARVTRLADAPPLGSQKAAVMQPGGGAAPSGARTSAVRLRSRWGDVGPAAEGPEDGPQMQRKHRRSQVAGPTAARGVMGGLPAKSAPAVPVISTSVPHAEGRGISTAVSQPGKQKTATQKPLQARTSTAASLDARSSSGAAGPPLIVDEVSEARELNAHGPPRKQSAQRRVETPVSASEAARPASPSAPTRADPRRTRELRPSAPRAAELPDWMVAEPDWLVAASAALDALPVPFVALPSPLLRVGSVANSAGGADQAGDSAAARPGASADGVPPHLLAAHDQLLATDEAAGVPAGQQPAAAATADTRPAKRPKLASKEAQQRHAGADSGTAAGAKPAAKPAAKPSKASRRQSGTAEAQAPSRPAKPASVAATAVATSAAADGAAVQASTAGDVAAKAPVRRISKVASSKLRPLKERAAAPAALAPVAGSSKADAPAAPAVTRPAASQAQRYVPTGRLDQKAAPSRALVAKMAGLQAAPRPAPVRMTTWEAVPPSQAPDPNLIITFESSDDEGEGEEQAAGAAVPVPSSPAEAALDRAAQAAAASGFAPPLASSAADDALARQMAALRAGASSHTPLQRRSPVSSTQHRLMLQLEPCSGVAVIISHVFQLSGC